MNNLPVKTTGDLVQPINLEELITSFIDAQDVRDSSKEAYRKALRLFLKWLRDKGIVNPKRQTILDYKADLRARGLSPLSVSAYIVTVRKFFGWLEATRGYPNIARGIKGAKRSRGFKKDPLTVSQVKELLDSIDKSSLIGLRDHALINLLVRTGLRTIEIVRTDIGDIRQQGGEALLYIQGKGRDDKDEFVLLTEETLKPIYEYLKERKSKGKIEPIFSSHSNRNEGQRLTTKTIRRTVKERLRGIGIDSDRLTTHSLRHTAITLSLQAGATIQEAQALGRHANINTTLIYAHNIDRIKQAPERKIDVILSRNRGKIDNIILTSNTVLFSNTKNNKRHEQ